MLCVVSEAFGYAPSDCIHSKDMKDLTDLIQALTPLMCVVILGLVVLRRVKLTVALKKPARLMSAQVTTDESNR